jgi:hypothetical protein
MNMDSRFRGNDGEEGLALACCWLEFTERSGDSALETF